MTTPAETPRQSQPKGEDPPLSTARGRTESHPTLPTAGAPPVPNAPAESHFPGYEIVRELGRGGMGVVYQAFDRKRQRMVALKTMQAIDPRTLLRFKQEFRSLTGLNHTNLVTLYELIGDGLHWFFTMELIEGVPFLHHLHGAADATPSLPTNLDTGLHTMPARVQPTPLSAAEVERLRDALLQLANGVHFLHESGKLHRDIKPGNVLVTANRRVVLLDFGLATEMDRDQQHRSMHLLGTVAYMAPEQAANQPVSPASDWYAVGVLLYEALTRALPFDGTAYEILHYKQHLDPPAPATIVPGTAVDLSTLCMRLLCRDPQARPRGAEVLNLLSANLQSFYPLEREDLRVKVSPRLHRLEVPLIGRSSHLQQLNDALDKTRKGRTVLVDVHGRSGAGKSALVQRFLDDLHANADTVILKGRCYEQESVPYKALDSLIDSLSRYLEGVPAAEAQALWPRDMAALARVFPVLRRLDGAASVSRRPVEMSDPQELRRRALAALRELLARLGDRRALVLAIDDVQWGDEDSAALLTDLLRPPDPPVLLLLLCYRSEDAESSPCLLSLRKIHDLGGVEHHELPVEPLSPDERRELAIALLDPRDNAAAARAESIAHQSGGYPFFVYELVQYLQVSDSGSNRSAETLQKDISLSEVLWSRMVSLPQEARRLLEVVAVASHPLAQADACRAAGIADEQTVLACLRAGRLLRRTGPGEQGEIETYHDRIRETVLLHLDAPTLRRHHQRLVEVLEASGRADPELLAVHLMGAGDSRRAGHYYALAAAQAVETLAFDRAAKLYRFALELQTLQGEEKLRLWTELAAALANAGRGAESAHAYLTAAADAPTTASLDLQRNAALQFLRSGHIDDGLATLRTVLEAIGLQLLPTRRRALLALVWQRLRLMLRGLRYHLRPVEQIAPAELARLDICQSAAIGLSMVDTLQGAYFQTRSSLLALQIGERNRLVTALSMEAAHISVGGSRSRRSTRRYLQAVDTLAHQANHPYARAMACLSHGIAASLAGDWRDGQRQCDEAEQIFRESCTGALWELGTAHRFALWPLMFMGEVIEINRRLPRLLKEACERDDLYEETNLCLAIRTFVRLAADEPQRARSDLTHVMAKWTQHGFHVQHMNRLFDETQIDLYMGDAERAWHRLADAWPDLERSYLLHVQQVRIVMLDLRARCALACAGGRDSVTWLRRAQGDARRLHREKVPWAAALARLVESALAFHRGETKRAAECLNQAIAGFTNTDMNLNRSVASRRLGQMLGQPQGQEQLRKADDWMSGQAIRNLDRMTDLLAPGWNAT